MQAFKLLGLLLLHSTLAWADISPPPPNPSAAEYRTATLELKSNLQAHPDDREARRKLGLIELEFGRGAEAEKELRQAIALGVFPETLQIPLTESLLMQGKFQEVLDQKLPLALLAEAHQATLMAYRGESWLGLNRPEKAEEEFGRALQLDPRCAAAKLGMARLAQSRRQFHDAEQLIAEVLATAPDDAKAWSLQGSLFEATGRLEQAEESYGKAIALKKFSPIEHASRALIRINDNRMEAAQADLDVLRRKAPDFFLALYAEGLMNLRREQYEEAQSNLEKALKRNDRFNSIHYYLGIAHFFQGHDLEAEKYLQTFSAYQPEVPEAKLFLALLKFRKGYYEETRSLLNTVLAKQPDNPTALKLMSDLEVLSGNREQGLQYLKKFSELKRRQVQAQNGKPRETAGPADKVDILSGLEVSRGVDPELARNVTSLVLRYLRAGEFKQAEAAVDKVRKKAPNNPLADYLAGLIELAQNAPDKARTAFEKALAKKPGDPVLIHTLAQLALRNQDAGKARQLYAEALARDPGNQSFRMSLAELDGYEGKTGEMEERLAGIVKDYPTDLEPRMTLAAHFLKTGQPSRAQAVLEEIREGYPHNPALTTLLIKVQLDNHQSGQALATAKAFVADEPNSAMAYYLLASAHAQNRDQPQMRGALEKAMSLDRQFLPARYSLIKLLASRNDFARAHAELSTLAGEYPDNVEVALLQGWMASAEGKPGEAVAAYQAAWNKAKTSETVTSLAKAEWQAGDRDRAIGLLEDWIQSHPDAALPRIAVADFYTAAGKSEPAIRHLEKVLQKHPENTLVLNNLAWLCRKTDPDKALGAARRAASLAPHAPNVLDTLAMIELDRGDTHRAIELLSHAAKLAPAQKPIRYHLALAQNKAGKPREAIRLLQEVLADKRPFPEQKDASALLEKLSAK